MLAELEALAARGFQRGRAHRRPPRRLGRTISIRRVDLVWLLDTLVEQGRFRAHPPLVDRSARGDASRWCAAMAGAPAVCPHLHVPLQAADDGVLAPHAPALRHRARRRAPRDDPRAAAGRGDRHRSHRRLPGRGRRRVRAHAARSSRRSPLTYGHVFPYSVRSGTTAAKLDGQQPPRDDRGARPPAARRVRAQARRRSRVASTAPPPRCWSRRRAIRQTGELRGYTRNYLRAHLRRPGHLDAGTRASRSGCASGARARVEADAPHDASCRAALEAGLGHRFLRPEHLARGGDASLVSAEAPNNETLEFLGDAVLALAMADLLMQRFPGGARGRPVEAARRPGERRDAGRQGPRRSTSAAGSGSARARRRAAGARRSRSSPRSTRRCSAPSISTPATRRRAAWSSRTSPPT